MLEPGSAGIDAHRHFVSTLPEEERMLLTLLGELYEGQWDPMAEDLRDRLQGKPYVFKLVNRIEEDLKRIARLRQYEEKHDVRLLDLLSDRG